MNNFEVGDVVKLVTGAQPQLVVALGRRTIATVYLSSSGNIRDYRSETDFEFYRGRITSEHLSVLADVRKYHGPMPQIKSKYLSKGNTNMPVQPTLYQTTEETPRFGTKIGVNSEGKWIMELKGVAQPVVFDKKDLNEVTPYTVDIVFRASHGPQGGVYSYISKPGDVEKGDLILLENGSMASVKAVDTKSKRADVELKGRKLVTEAFGESEEAKVLLTE